MSLPNRVIGGGVRRLPQVNMTASTSLRNKYISGANIGAIATSNRLALKRRSGCCSSKGDGSIAVTLSNHVFQNLISGQSTLRMAPALFSSSAPPTSNTPSPTPLPQPQPIAYRDNANRITMIKVDRSLPVVYKYAPVFVGWLMVYDKNASVLSDITNFDINVNFGYFTTTQSDHPEAATAWFNVHIDPDFFVQNRKADLSIRTPKEYETPVFSDIYDETSEKRR